MHQLPASALSRACSSPVQSDCQANCRMTDFIYIQVGSSDKTKTMRANPPPLCKDVTETFGGGTLEEDGCTLLQSCILEAGKHYTFIKEVAAAAPDHALMEQALRTVAGQQTTLDEIRKTAEERHNTLYQDLLQIKRMMGGTLARRHKLRGAQPGKYGSILSPVIEAGL
ncbi:hypothetical protein WJX72_006596 [[Myrmecia] bisecta]|uniref:Uncharacterized protein n=1 Tax=[Myrmecia] bisecta TaxID=41462 RepID=A0AAW1QFK3_9CHLO